MRNLKQDWPNELLLFLSRPWILVIALIFILAPAARISDALESGAQFLKIGTDAKAVSMASAYTAAANDINSMTYNPAGLAYLKETQLGFSHVNWLLGGQHDFIGFGVPINVSRATGPQVTPPSCFVLGLGIERLTHGSLQSHGADRSAGGSYAAYDQAVSAVYAGKIGRTSAGIGVKYIESSIAGQRASAVAVDLGLIRGVGRLPVSIGVSVQNLGTSMKYITQKDPLPLTLVAGMLLNIIPGFNLALDVKRLVYDKQTNVSFGMEYALLPMVSLRTGYLLDSPGPGAGLNAINAGAGIRFLSTQLDYAVTPCGGLGNAQRITLKKKL